MALAVLGAVVSPGAAAADAKPLAGQWWFSTWGVNDKLWPKSKGQGVTVALSDTGVQAGLPDFTGRITPGTDFETGSGNGTTDDNSAFGSPGHGTYMASLIVGQGGRSGFLGVAPEAKVLPVVAQTSVSIAKGIRYAADHGAKVINLSQALPGACPIDMQQAVHHALSKDAVVVAGAGNDGNGSNQSMHPANCRGVLSVGSVDPQFRPWEKTQRQSYVKVAAPGVRAGGVGPDGKHNPYFSGTSQASALTAGMVALIRSRYPEMRNREVVRQLVASALDIDAKGRDDRTGYGIIRPNRIFIGDVPKTSANPVFDEYDRWAANHGPDAEKPLKEIETPIAWDAVAYLGGLGGAAVVAVAVVGFMAMRKKRQGPRPATGPGQGMPPAGFGGAPHPPQGGQQYPPQPGRFPQQPQGAPQAPPPGRPQFHPPQDR
ncbi:subtilisin family serine protease [Actinomadura namibiensis]|uniref:Subtilisin family serine protease n=1 Tax=Actinomadura namibiensis TaxID=182080 RepID=A0A7W3LWH7_ACTNM|nr:subtilisin family serine protease [Actinomadura namibiensis]